MNPNLFPGIINQHLLTPVDILGFGARALFNSKAKYINSPNSEIFQKSQILYGISHLQREYLKDNPNDQKIKEIAQDELNHVQELNQALSMLTSV